MAVFLALFSAATYGIADFCGGVAARRIPATTVLLWSHILGLGLLLVSASVVGGSATGADLLIGAVGGLCGAAGVGFLYKGLAVGPMSVVAPITALLSASVPVLAGLLQGERPSATVTVGMIGALAAIVLVSAEGEAPCGRPTCGASPTRLAAGLGFGLFFVALSYAGDDSGLWPLVAARVASVTAVGSLALLGRVPRGFPRPGSDSSPPRPGRSMPPPTSSTCWLCARACSPSSPC